MKVIPFWSFIFPETYIYYISCIYLYPPKGKAKRSQWGPLDNLSILYVVGEPKLGFQKYEGISAFFEISKTFIVRMGGWMGGWVSGDQKGPSIFLIFRYIDKQCLVITNMVSKSVYGFFIKSYEHFTFRNS